MIYKIKTNCLICHKEIWNWPCHLKRGEGKYCSFKCRGYALGKANFKTGVLIDNNGYRRILKHEHPNTDSKGYVLEHRYILEKKIGRLLERWEIAHHINGNKLDNRPENIQLMQWSEHTTYENKKRNSYIPMLKARGYFVRGVMEELK